MSKSIDRWARSASLFGLLGLAGVAGFVDYRLFALSSFSFFSYVCFFRFFAVAFPRDRAPVLGGVVVPTALAGLIGSVLPPWFGFLGFVGYVGWVIDKPARGRAVTRDA